MKKVALLGSSGSIGQQSLEVIRRQGYQVVALCVQRNIDALWQQALEFTPPVLAVYSEAAAEVLRGRLPHRGYNPQLLAGPDAARNAVAESGADIVLNAIVGIAGLDATLTSLAGGMDVALANKESLVTGGQLVLREAAATGARLLPVDSEHSAIFQCLQDPQGAKSLERIILTASGGPFYGWGREQLANVSPEQALNHPNWSMGPKITVDSATLMNKGLELIEAMWLFGLPPGQIEIVVQRQSIIHSMVEFSDCSVLAQMGVPDMRLPIQYALTWPERVPGVAPRLDFARLESLSFGPVDEETFRCLYACRRAAEMGGLAACAANGANEEAVALFLQGQIGFLDIGRLVEGCTMARDYSGGYDLEDVYACDIEARRYVREHV